MTTTIDQIVQPKKKQHQDLIAYLNAKRRSILVQTYEESRFLDDLEIISAKKGATIYFFSLARGLHQIKGPDAEKKYEEKKIFDLVGAISFVTEQHGLSYLVVLDAHELWNDPRNKRDIRDHIEHFHVEGKYRPIIFVSPHSAVPLEIEKHTAVTEFELPSRDELKERLDDMVALLAKKKLQTPTGSEYEAILNAINGLTFAEADNILKKSATKHQRLDINEITLEKAAAIKKSGLLRLITNTMPLDDVGGIDNLRKWLERAKLTMRPEARKYIKSPAKGLILNGFPGTGKSALAKGIAHDWNLPLLQLSMSSIMDALVGSSERNIRRALSIAEDISPCILWIDEMEKAFAGMTAQGGDAGTSQRVMQELLTWLSDREKPVFVVATSNSLENIPDELTRAGRFDDMFFVSIPYEEERYDIVKIQLNKAGVELTDGETRMAAKLLEGFTGAEIEQVIKEGVREAYLEMVGNKSLEMTLTLAHLEPIIKEMSPLSRKNPGLLQKLRNWAKQSARCVSSEEHSHLFPSKAEHSNESKSLFDEGDLF